ncbi:hypothetical protein ACOME3_004002 [Neoechinorhynchus agilis]
MQHQHGSFIKSFTSLVAITSRKMLFNVVHFNSQSSFPSRSNRSIMIFSTPLSIEIRSSPLSLNELRIDCASMSSARVRFDFTTVTNYMTILRALKGQKQRILFLKRCLRNGIIPSLMTN